MSFLVPAAVLAFAAIPAIVALYFLKVRRPEVRFSSLLLWRPHVADRQANAPWRRLRLSVLLALQLLVAMALALALTRPAVAGATDRAQTTVVLIDGSPTMQATDVKPTRFAAAVAQVREMGKGLAAGKEVAVVVLGAHAQQLTPPTHDPTVLDAALDRAGPAAQRANLGEGISLANAVLAGRAGGRVLLLSDGGLEPAASAERLTAPLTYRSIGVTGENVGIEAVLRKADGNVAIRLVNVGQRRHDVEVQLRADGRLVDVIPLDLEGGTSSEATWTGLPAGTGLVEARLAADDDFPLDDRAWLLTDVVQRRRVLLVTPENGFLERVLRARTDLDVTVVPPGGYRAGDRYDLSVFDRFVPPAGGTPPGPSPAIYVAPPPGSGLLPAGADAVDPGDVLPGNPREPLLRYVNLRDVHIQAASPVDTPPDWRPVISAAHGPLLLVHQGEPRAAVLTFDIHRSDLPLRPAFPILVDNLLSQLLPGGFQNQQFQPGDIVSVGGSSDVTKVEVIAPDGARTRFAPPFPVAVHDTARPGVYEVRTATRGGPVAQVSHFVVQLDVARDAYIAPGPAPEIKASAVTRPGVPVRGTRELWAFMALAALVGLAVEWVVFLRG